MPNRHANPSLVTEAEARRRLGEAYRILLDLAAKRRERDAAQVAVQTTDTTKSIVDRADERTVRRSNRAMLTFWLNGGGKMAESKKGQKRGRLELLVTPWQVFGLMLLAGVGLTVLIALGTILLLTSSPARFDQIMALLGIVLRVAVP